MDIKEIYKTYGKVDYMDMNCPGRIYHFTQMEYHLYNNETHIPVSENGIIVGVVKVEGNLITPGKRERGIRNGKH